MGLALNLSFKIEVSAGEKPFSGPMKKMAVFAKGPLRRGAEGEISPKKREPEGGCQS